MKTFLTPQEEQLMYSVRDEWLEKMFNPAKHIKLNKVKVKQQIKWLYEFSGLNEPEIIFVDSPLGLQFAANLIFYKDILGKKNIRENVGENIRENVWKNIRENVWKNIWENVGENVWKNVGENIRENVWKNVGKNVWENVGENVGEDVRNRKIGYFDSCLYGSILDWGWVSFHDFFTRISILSNKDFNEFLNLINSGIYDMIQMDKICFICGMPIKVSKINMDGEFRLHAIDDFAIKWPDGYGQYYLYGVFFPPYLHKKIVTGKMNFSNIMKIQNVEQRQVALRYIGAGKLLESVNAKLLDKSTRGNKLYIIGREENIFPQDEYFVKLICPSTGRIYIHCIEPEIGEKHDADLAVATMFQIPDVVNDEIVYRSQTKEEYLSIVTET